MAEEYVPYRRMPFRYVVVWVCITMAIQAIWRYSDHGWPAFTSIEVLVQIIGTGLLGGIFWGWLLWRLGLYRQFPNL